MAIHSNEPLSETSELTLESADPAVSAGEANHADPITGEPGAHPAAVGIGAVAAGAAGAAAIGAFAGPIGALIGAAIGAVAGGLAGHEVAASNDETTETVPTGDLNAEANGSTTDASGRPASVTTFPEENITVFPGLDMGSPAVTTQSAAAAFAGDAFASGPELEAGDTVVPESAPVPKAAAVPVPAAKQGFAFGTDTAVQPAGSLAAGEHPTETIRTAAYYRYLGRAQSGQPEDALADWYDAEREVYSF